MSVMRSTGLDNMDVTLRKLDDGNSLIRLFTLAKRGRLD